LSASNANSAFDPDKAKDSVLLQGSFMALEFILSKAQNPGIRKLVSEIFNPTTSIPNREMNELTAGEEFDSYENGESIQYLAPNIISLIVDHLQRYSEPEIKVLYNAKELNDEGIYPWCWQPGESHDDPFNEKVVVQDFVELKAAFLRAKEDNDTLLVFVG
jgi:hypothetical protein